MARIRSVHPDLLVSETMADLPAELERTFVRLLVHCDDQGRCHDNPRLLKAALYPLHDDVTAATLRVEITKLARAGLVRRYEGGGSPYLCIPSWDEYQHPRHPSTARIPEPPEQPPEGYGETPQDARQTHASVGVEKEIGEGVGEGGEAPGVAIALNGASPAVRPVDTVFAEWQETTGHHKAVLDPKRRRAIGQALKNYPLQDVLDAVRGVRLSDFHNGQNDSRARYDDLCLILRDSEHIEKFRDLARDGPTAQPLQKSRGGQAVDRVFAALEANDASH